MTAIDARSQRKAATRDAIADALLDLLTDGNLRPTAREIAQRAGISLRSVYVHFDDLEDLFCVAAKRHYQRVAPMLTPVAATGPLIDRARSLVEHRVQLYKQIGPVARATQLQAPASPTLARIVRDSRARSKREIEVVFAPELDPIDDDRRRRFTVALVDALTSGHTWESLRETHDLDVRDAIDCVVDAIVAELERAA